MDFASTILGSILSTAGEYLVEPTLRQGRYLFCFKSINEDLKKEDENLRSTQEHVQQQVDTARRNTEEIETDVKNWLTKASSVVADVRSLEDEINADESRLNGWCSNWVYKYKLSRRAAKQTSILLKLQDAGKFNNISHPAILPGIEFLAPKDFMTFESTKFAFDGIIKALKDDGMSIVGLYGMGGVGKTTLAKAVGNASKEQKIFNEVIVVDVSQAINIMNIQDQIADSLSLRFEEKSEQGRAKRLFLRLKDENKILLILDDVWAKLDLTRIGIPYGNEHIGCKILVTTRVERVCIAMECQEKVQLNVLSQKEGMDLFNMHAGVGDDSPVLSDAAKEILKECNGLPLAIVTIGRALRERTIEEWKAVIQKLKKSKLMDADIVDANLYACLKLSYDYLKSEKTKLCFLLCSLFPEDHKIDMEELLRYGLGLGWYQDTNSIEEARTELCVMVNNLKASSLLLDANEGFVKMHDVVRDAALWITSKGENVFMVKAGMGLTDWPKHEGLEQCTAVSLIGNKIEVLPDDLVCPKLLILLLGSYYSHRSKIRENFFEEMKALKVVTLVKRKLSLKSLESLTNLVTLQLISCKLRDISSLKKLAKLEILSLKNSVFDESLEDLKELSKLRMLDLRYCYLERIPVDVISRLSRLEQLHIISNSSKAQKVDGISAERSSASLFELNKLYCLTILSLTITVHQRLPKDFVLQKKLLKYDIRVNHEESSEPCPKSRSLSITYIEGVSLFAFKSLYENAEYLELYNIIGCCQNMVPSIDKTGLNELKRLSLKRLQEVECIIDMTQQHVPSIAFSNMVYLHLYDLPNLRCIWKGPTQQVNLQRLTVVEVANCNKLRYVFTLNLARSLLQLQQLLVNDCNSLEHIVQIKAEETEDNVAARDGTDVVFPKLRTLKLKGVEKLINFCSENYTSTWPALQELILDQNPSLVAELRANIQTAKEALRALEIRAVSDEFCKAAVAELHNNFQNLEDLMIRHCRGVQVIFEVEQQFSLSSLKVLELWVLKDLEYLSRGPPHLLSLPNLQLLRVWNCERLRHLLSSTLARNLLRLETISISDCGELEQLMVEDDREDRVQLPLFPNLSRLYVQRCDKLKTLFSVSIARRLDLQQLTSLQISRSRQLEEIFGPKDEADMTTGDTELQLVLPRLRKLELGNLNRLVNFCPSGYQFIFPSLSWLMVENCPKITTRFSVDRNGSVHAQVQAPHTDNQHVHMEHFPLQTAKNIYCWDSNCLREKLPPYGGK